MTCTRGACAVPCTSIHMHHPAAAAWPACGCPVRMPQAPALSAQCVCCRRRGEGEVVAQWRVKVHAARKRVILVVWGMIRFKSTIKMRSRLRRVDTWGYMIPSLLGPGERQQELTGCRGRSLKQGSGDGAGKVTGMAGRAQNGCSTQCKMSNAGKGCRSCQPEMSPCCAYTACPMCLPVVPWMQQTPQSLSWSRLSASLPELS